MRKRARKRTLKQGTHHSLLSRFRFSARVLLPASCEAREAFEVATFPKPTTGASPTPAAPWTRRFPPSRRNKTTWAEKRSSLCRRPDSRRRGQCTAEPPTGLQTNSLPESHSLLKRSREEMQPTRIHAAQRTFQRSVDFELPLEGNQHGGDDARVEVDKNFQKHNQNKHSVQTP